MITKETVVEFFNNITDNNTFDISKELLWSYFFLSADKKNLEDLKLFLEKKGYKFGDLFLADKENENDLDEFYLQMEKIEKQNIESLQKRNQEFYSLANEYFVEYDGFDVGNS